MGILNVQGIDVTMGGHDILHDVTLEVAEHAVVSVIGSNGVGKTTLMRAISGDLSLCRGDHYLPRHTHRQSALAQNRAPGSRAGTRRAHDLQQHDGT